MLAMQQVSHFVQLGETIGCWFYIEKKSRKAEGFHPQHLLDLKRLHPPAPEHQEAPDREVLFREHRGQVPPDHQEDLH